MGEFTNKVQVITNDFFKSINNELFHEKNALIVELDGFGIQSWRDFAIAMQHKFSFPSSCLDSIDRYLDWMRDLTWLNHEKIILVIHNFKFFLKDDQYLKNEIISDFNDIILPFWEQEVEEVVINGKAKPFMVYLIE